jgi:Flp pilus assembly protein TadG
MRGTVTNLRMIDNGYIEVTITADLSTPPPTNGLRMTATVQVGQGAEPRLGSAGI